MLTQTKILVFARHYYLTDLGCALKMYNVVVQVYGKNGEN